MEKADREKRPMREIGPNILTRLTLDEHAQIIAAHGYSVTVCPICHQICVASPGYDPFIEGKAQGDVEKHLRCPDVLYDVVEKV